VVRNSISDGNDRRHRTIRMKHTLILSIHVDFQSRHLPCPSFSTPLISFCPSCSCCDDNVLPPKTISSYLGAVHHHAMPNRAVRVTAPPRWQFFAPAELGDLWRASQEKHFEKRTSWVLQATNVARMRSLAKKKKISTEYL